MHKEKWSTLPIARQEYSHGKSNLHPLWYLTLVVERPAVVNDISFPYRKRNSRMRLHASMTMHDVAQSSRRKVSITWTSWRAGGKIAKVKRGARRSLCNASGDFFRSAFRRGKHLSANATSIPSSSSQRLPLFLTILRTQPEECGRIGQSHRSDSKFINFIPFLLLAPSCILEILRSSYLLFHPPLLLTARTSFFEEQGVRRRESREWGRAKRRKWEIRRDVGME